MLTDCHPLVDWIPREWWLGYHHLYPSLRETGMCARKLDAETRLTKFLDTVSEDGQRPQALLPSLSSVRMEGHNQPTLTQEQREVELPELYRANKSIKRCASHFGVSHRVISRWLHRLHEPMRPRGRPIGSTQTPEQIAKRGRPELGPPRCHPAEKHYGLGLCSKCYEHQRHVRRYTRQEVA